MASDTPIRTHSVTSYLSLAELECLLVGVVLVVPYFSLPFPFSFVLGVLFVAAPGCLAVAALRLRADPIRKLLLAAATSVGLLVASVGAVAILLSMAGVTRPMDQPFVFLGPTLATSGAYAAFVRRRGHLIDRLATATGRQFDHRRAVEYAAIATLPCLGAAGAHVTNITGWHGLSVGFYLFVMVFVLYFLSRDGTSAGQYTAATYALGLALVVALTLRTTAVVGADVHGEVGVIRRVLERGHWTIPSTGTNLDTVASLLILGPFLVSLFDVPPVLAVKLVYPLFIAVIPLGGFVLFRTVVPDRLAFAGAVVTMYHVTYWGSLHSNNRMVIAVVFALGFLVSVVSDDRNRFLEVLFLVGIVVSHYTVAVVFGAFYFLFIIGTTVYQLLGYRRIPTVYWQQLVLIGLFMYLWYEVIRGGVFFDLFVLGIVELINTAATYAPTIVPGGEVGSDITAAGVGNPTGSSSNPNRSVPDLLLLATLGLEFVLMGLGGAYVTLSLVDLGRFDPLARFGISEMAPSWLDCRSASPAIKGLWIGALAGLGMFMLGFVMDSSLGPSRIQNQMQFVYTVLLFPGLFVVSLLLSRLSQLLSQSIEWKPMFRIILVLFVVLSIPLQTGLVHLSSGDSINVNLGGPDDDRYLSREDVAMAGWLANNSLPDSGVHTDDKGRGLIVSETSSPSLSQIYFPQGTQHEYALVRTVVTVRTSGNRSQIQSATGATVATEPTTWGKVYDAGTAELYYRPGANATQSP